mmetsp:Transcript_8448/g.12892  ORF Transcript_8448/g.12892 Transcript_8448/m.12892 type:complete len:139 (+) Transcript_8448:2986-3402(+)
MGRDISLLRHFNLMDYSLLFIIEYNPKYVEYFPEQFVHDNNGKLKYPVEEKITKKKKGGAEIQTKSKQQDIADDFLQKMSGHTTEAFLHKIHSLAEKKEAEQIRKETLLRKEEIKQRNVSDEELHVGELMNLDSTIMK